MRRVIFWLLFCSLIFSSSPVGVQASVPARCYVVMEATNGEVLEGKDIHRIRSVASISKIMTAILAIESDRLFEVVTVGDEIDRVVGSSLYLEKGSQITIIDLVYGLLLRSGNDAAMIIAHHLGDGVANFVQAMNQKAAILMMHHTTFHNPHGLDIDDEGNLSSAYDMALLMRYCLSNEIYRQINMTKNYKSPLKGTWHNKHRLINQYEYATGGKTGYTSKAKRTLITAAQKDGLELIVVTLDCGGDFAFHRERFERYFSQYVFLMFITKGTNVVDCYVFEAAADFGAMIKREKGSPLLIIYALDPERKLLSFQVMNQDGEVEEYGPISLISYHVSVGG